MKLSEMSLEELWQLFPIFLTEHNDDWKQWYEEERNALAKTFNDRCVSISHIGSTAINGIYAKPIIDILMEIPAEYNIISTKNKIMDSGYLCMSENKHRISFNKGYTPDGFSEKVFHLHLRYRGDNDELYFRDYMNNHLGAAKEYEALKLSLWKKFEYNRDAYTNAKSDFISKYTNHAKKIYSGRYN